MIIKKCDNKGEKQHTDKSSKSC